MMRPPCRRGGPGRADAADFGYIKRSTSGSTDDMPTSPRDHEAMRMAVAVLNQWINSPDVGALPLIEAYRSDTPDAVEMILGGLIPIAGHLLGWLAKERNVSPQDILKHVGEYLAGLE